VTTREEIISEVDARFADIPRPLMFIRGTCMCEECLEHEKVMQSFTRDALPFEELHNPGWDPICFASDTAFHYLVPGLVRLVLKHTDSYIQQFLFHVASRFDQADRTCATSPAQIQSLIQVLDFLLVQCNDALQNNLAADELNRIKTKLEQFVSAIEN
jgi:hypothetical protein